MVRATTRQENYLLMQVGERSTHAPEKIVLQTRLRLEHKSALAE